MPKTQETAALGLVGCGDIAFQKHLPALRASGRARLVAFCDVNRAAAQKAATEYGCEGAAVYTDWQAFVQDAHMQAVSVCTANASHAPIAVAALRAGKHVLCEKPMARTAMEARQMVEAAEQSGRKLTISYQNRFKPAVRELYRRCRAGELGEIYYAKAVAIRRRGIPTWGSFTNREAQGGGCLIDMGTHAIDQTLWLMDNYEVAQVCGSTYNHLGKQGGHSGLWGAWRPEAFQVEDAAFALVRMKNGATVSIECSWALNTLDVGENRTTLCGTLAGADLEAGLRLNTAQGSALLETKVDAEGGTAMGWRPKNVCAPTQYQLECNAWLDALLEDGPPPAPPRQALVVCQIIDAVYESARTGETVRF